MFESIRDASKRQATTAEFNRVMAEFKTTQIFPNGNLPKDFLEIARKCLSFHSPTSLQMNTETFRGIKKNHDLNFCFLDMGTIVYCMQARSQAEMGMDHKEYDEFLSLTDLVVLEWTTLMTNQTAAVSKQLEERALAELLLDETKQKLMEEAIEKGKAELEKEQHITIPLGAPAMA